MTGPEFPPSLLEQLVQMAPGINRTYTERESRLLFPAAEWHLLCSAGIAGGCIPAAQGGAALTYRGYAQLLEQMGLLIEDNGLNFSVMAHALACVWPVYLHAQAGPLQDLLPAFTSGKNIMANAMTEEQGGSDAFNMRTTATFNGSEYILNGHKSFCTNGPVATHALVYAETAPGKGFFGGISAFVVDLALPGVKKGDNLVKMGLRTATASALSFEQVKLSPGFLLGKPGEGGMIFSESMVLEKIFMSAAHTGTLQRWLRRMHEFAAQRNSGGHPLTAQQSVMHMLADVKTNLAACKALVGEAVLRLETASLSDKIDFAAMTKHFVSTTMTETAQKYLALFAGKGYLHQNGIEAQVRDFMASTIYSGTAEIQKNIIARGPFK